MALELCYVQLLAVQWPMCFPHVSTAAVFTNPHFLPQASPWHPLIPSLHFPCSLSPSQAFFCSYWLARHTLTHANSLLFTFSVLLPLILFFLLLSSSLLHLASFQHASHCFSFPLFISLSHSLFLSTCSSHALLSAPTISSIQPGCSIDEGSTIEQYKSACQRSNLWALPLVHSVHYKIVISSPCLTP